MHIDAQVRKSLTGETVFYFDVLDPQVPDDDKVFSITDLKIAKINILLIAESYFELNNLLIDSVFYIIPFKSKFWNNNPILLFYSPEFIFYQFYSKYNNNNGNNEEKRGKIENITRINSKTFLKYLSEIIISSFEIEKSRYLWVLECPISRLLLFNYLMSYFFLSWQEYKCNSTHLICPIRNLLPQKLDTIYFEVYKFLESLTGIS